MDLDLGLPRHLWLAELHKDLAFSSMSDPFGPAQAAPATVGLGDMACGELLGDPREPGYWCAAEAWRPTGRAARARSNMRSRDPSSDWRAHFSRPETLAKAFAEPP